jgi:hypothetical protein
VRISTAHAAIVTTRLLTEATRKPDERPAVSSKPTLVRAVN